MMADVARTTVILRGVDADEVDAWTSMAAAARLREGLGGLEEWLLHAAPDDDRDRERQMIGQASDRTDGLELRPATWEDAEFLYELLRAAMREHVERIWTWDERWQRDHFYAGFHPAKERIITQAGRDIGVIAIEEREDEVFLSKIYLLPAAQGQGIGTLLIRDVLRRAATRGMPVTLQVLHGNPARQLYERLGFVPVEKTATHWRMRAMPDA